MSSSPSYLNLHKNKIFKNPIGRQGVENLKPQNKIKETQNQKETVPPIYFGGARLVNWGNTARGGMTIEIALKDVGPRDVNPFKGLAFGKSNGQRLKTWVGPYAEAIDIGELPIESIYRNESQLMYYGDTCTKGVTAKVMLDAGPDGANGTHPFEGMDIGNIEGQDLYVSFWLINDDETIVPRNAVKSKTPFYQLSAVRQSNIIVNDQEFVNFLSKRLLRLIGKAVPETDIKENQKQWATEVIKLHLNITSRAIMNHETIESANARKKWKNIMSEYFQSEEYHSRRPFIGR